MLEAWSSSSRRLCALLVVVTVLLDVSQAELSISRFACADTWNPTVTSNAKITVNSLCQLNLRLSILESAANKTLSNVSAISDGHLTVDLLVTSGFETLRANSIHGVDYWTVASLTATPTFDANNGSFDVSLANVRLQLPSICGQTYLVARVQQAAGSSIEQSTPIQLQCLEKNVDLALVGETKETYDMYSHRPVLQTTGQSLSYFIPELKLWVKNVMDNATFSSRTGPSAYTVSAYLKPQLWYMFQWFVGNDSYRTVAQVDHSQLDYQLGDVLMHVGNRLVVSHGGRATSPMPSGYQAALQLENLALGSKEVCGNGIMVVHLEIPHRPADSNMFNNYYILPVFVDCWGHNPVHAIETCQVVPNYYDGGQTAWITYTVPGQTKIFEYKTDEKTVRPMNVETESAVLQDVAVMKLNTGMQSDRLQEIGQCVDTVWGMSDTFITSLDVLSIGFQKSWKEIKPENEIQRVEHGKIGLIVSVLSDLVSLALQTRNPLHGWLHIPFHVAFSPEGRLWEDEHLATNQVNRKRRDVDEFEVNNDEDDPEEVGVDMMDDDDDNETIDEYAYDVNNTVGAQDVPKKVVVVKRAVPAHRGMFSGMDVSRPPASTISPASVPSTTPRTSSPTTATNTGRSADSMGLPTTASWISRAAVSTVGYLSTLTTNLAGRTGSMPPPHQQSTGDQNSGRLARMEDLAAASDNLQTGQSGSTRPSHGSIPDENLSKTTASSEQFSASSVGHTTISGSASTDGASLSSRSSTVPHETTGLPTVTAAFTGTTRTNTGGSRATIMTTASTALNDEQYFGPKPNWHQDVSKIVYGIIKYDAQFLTPYLSSDRIQAISHFFQTLYYGRSEDLDKYSYIPKATLDKLSGLLKMVLSSSLPRIFDNIPDSIDRFVMKWFKQELFAADSTLTGCEFRKGLEMLSNVTQNLRVSEEGHGRRDQLALYSDIISALLEEDNPEYTADLFNKIVSSTSTDQTWMIRDGVPIHEPDVDDVCRRYTAAKIWQLRTEPINKFAGRPVSPDHYKSVFWTEDEGTIYRGDRSDLTGQVFWSKVATCGCTGAGNSCSGSPSSTAAPTSGSSAAAAPSVTTKVTTTTTSSSRWATTGQPSMTSSGGADWTTVDDDPLIAAPVYRYHDEFQPKDRQDESSKDDVDNIEIHEDMLFSD